MASGGRAGVQAAQSSRADVALLAWMPIFYSSLLLGIYAMIYRLNALKIYVRALGIINYMFGQQDARESIFIQWQNSNNCKKNYNTLIQSIYHFSHIRAYRYHLFYNPLH